MPFTSTQVAGLVGGQQVMFANQHAYAQTIGYGSEGPPPQLSNPYPAAPPPSYAVGSPWPGQDAGAKVAGGIGMAIPGAVAGISMLGSFAGYKNPLGLLDPMTGISRAFGAGTGGSALTRAGVMAGREGLGIQYAAGNIGRAFMQGGMRAGLGAVGGGLAGAAAAAVPYYIAGKAIETVGTNIFQGAQNIKDVGRMAGQYFTPQYGQPGAGPQGQPGRGAVRQITGFLHEMAGEDVMSSMKDMRRLMDRAGRAGMLEGVGNVTEFKQRFREIVKKTRTVAQIMGTTLDEAMPLVQSLNKMGLWSAGDVMGTAVAAKAAGPGGGAAMVGAMQQGAQMSHAMGGTLRAGARTGREMFQQVTGAVQSGVLSREDIRNFTGGVTGAQGRQMVAGSLQQVMAGMGQTAMGRLMMAGMGEIKGGEFTGRMDPELLAKFQRGEMTIGQLQAQGKKRVRNKTLAVSFFNKAGEMGQNLGAQGGIEGMAMGIQQAMQKAGYGSASSPIQNRFIQLLTGASQKQADVIQKMIQEMPRITAERERRMEGVLDQSFRDLEQRQHGSWQGFKDAVGHVWEETIERPLQGLGENLATEVGSTIDRIGRKLTGRVRRMPKLSMGQQFNLARMGAMDREITPQMLGATHVGQGFVDEGAVGNMISRMQQSPRGFAGRVALGVGLGAAAGTIIPGAGTIGGALVGGTAAALGFNPFGALQKGQFGLTGSELANVTPRGQALMEAGLEVTRGGTPGAEEVSLRGGINAKTEDVRRIARKAMFRSIDATMGGLLGGETAKKRKNMDTVKTRIKQMFNNKDTRDALLKAKEEGPDKYQEKVMQMLGDDPDARKAMSALSASSTGGAGKRESMLDVLAVAQNELNYKQSDLAIDFDKQSRNIGVMTEGNLDQLHEKNLKELADISEGRVSTAGGAIGGALAGAALGAAVGTVVPIGGNIVGAIVGGVMGATGFGVAGGMLAGDQISEDEWAGILSSDKFSPKEVQEYLKTGKGNRFTEAVNQGDENAKRVMDMIKGMDQKGRDRLSKALGTSGNLQAAQMWQEKKKTMQSVAKAQGPITHLAGIKDESMRSNLERARQAFAKGDIKSGMQITAEASKGATSQREINLLLQGRGGEVGRQAGRLALIESMGELKEGTGKGSFEKFRQRMRQGGVDLFTGIDQEKLNQMLKGGIRGHEVGELKKMLKDVSAAALGEGPGARKSANDRMTDLLTKYTAANERFVTAVGVALGKDIKEAANKVNEANPNKGTASNREH